MNENWKENWQTNEQPPHPRKWDRKLVCRKLKKRKLGEPKIETKKRRKTERWTAPRENSKTEIEEMKGRDEKEERGRRWKTWAKHRPRQPTQSPLLSALAQTANANYSSSRRDTRCHGNFINRHSRCESSCRTLQSDALDIPSNRPNCAVRPQAGTELCAHQGYYTPACGSSTQNKSIPRHHRIGTLHSYSSIPQSYWAQT